MLQLAAGDVEDTSSIEDYKKLKLSLQLAADTGWYAGDPKQE